MNPNLNITCTLAFASLALLPACSPGDNNVGTVPSSPSGGAGGTTGSGGTAAISSAPASCTYNGQVYAIGQRFQVYCTACICGQNGEAVVSCAATDCPPGTGGIVSPVTVASLGGQAGGGAGGALASVGGAGGAMGEPQDSGIDSGIDSGTDSGTDSSSEDGNGTCGLKAKTILDPVPRGNTVPNWLIDIGNLKTADKIAAVATSERETIDLVDGSSEDFYAPPYQPVAFAWQNYVNKTLPSSLENPGVGAQLSLYVLQMPSPEQAAGLYRSLLQYPLYQTPWETPSSPLVGDESRIASGGAWTINFHKCNYYVEIRLTPSYGPAPGYMEDFQPSRAAAIAFATVIASRI